MAAGNEQGASSLWDTWAETLKAAASPMSAYASLIDGWRERTGAATAPSGESNSEPAQNASATIADTLLGGQRAMLRMMEVASETLRSVATPGSAGDAESALNRAMEQFRQKIGASPLLNGLDLWSAAAAQQHQLAEPWTELMQRWIGIAATLGGPSGAGDPLGDALERSFGVLADFPGVDKELPILVREAAVNTVALTSAREAYRVIMAATWQRAFEEITRELLGRSADGKPVTSAAALLSLSTTVADRVFVETFNSARYIDAQQHLSTALANQRRTEAKVVDLFARHGHFPTRRDHEEELREIAALRREVRALKRLVRNRAPERLERPAAALAASSNGMTSDIEPAAKAPRGAGGKPKKNVRGK